MSSNAPSHRPASTETVRLHCILPLCENCSWHAGGAHFATIRQHSTRLTLKAQVRRAPTAVDFIFRMSDAQLYCTCLTGGLDVAQLGLLLKELGHPMETSTVQDVFNDFDLDRSGKIEFSEFLRYCSLFESLPEEPSQAAWRCAAYPD